MSSPDFWDEITTSKPVEKPKPFKCTFKKFPNWAEHGFIMSLILAFSIQSQAYFCEFKFKANLLCLVVRSRTVVATKGNSVSKLEKWDKHDSQKHCTRLKRLYFDSINMKLQKCKLMTQIKLVTVHSV